MSIEQQPGKRPLTLAPPPTWGEIVPEGQTAGVIRFIATDRVITFVASEIKRWEHVAGEPEILTLQAGKEAITVEGHDLATVRASLDVGRLCELRPNIEQAKGRPGPRILRITIESA